jgi:4-hydroxybenzoate polyprenyltransferase
VVLLTQLLVYFTVFYPWYQQQSLSPVFGPWHLLVLACATIAVAAFAYLINDWYDQQTDAINRPDRALVAGLISQENWKTAIYVLAGAGAVLSGFLAWQFELWFYWALYPAALSGLWMYAALLSKIPGLTNVWVAVFCAGVPALVWLAMELTDPGWADRSLLLGLNIFEVMPHYILLAALVTLERELVKDLEDAPGDEQGGKYTLVQAWGPRAVFYLVQLTGALVFVLLISWSWLLFKHEGMPFRYLSGFCVLLAWWQFRLWKQYARYRDHHALQQSLLQLMGLGLGWLLLYLTVAIWV